MRSLLLLSIVCLGSGCASLSLFGSTHTHTHHHNDCDEDPIVSRLERIEQRLAAIEQGSGHAHASFSAGNQP